MNRGEILPIGIFLLKLRDTSGKPPNLSNGQAANSMTRKPQQVTVLMRLQKLAAIIKDVKRGKN
jgi:hypothetical protein